VIDAFIHRLVDLINVVEIRRTRNGASLRRLSFARKGDGISGGPRLATDSAFMAGSNRAFAMIFATAANVIPLFVSAAPAAPKRLAHTAIIHPDFLGRSRALWADGLKRQSHTRPPPFAALLGTLLVGASE
jgi:hypothetical protein